MPVWTKKRQILLVLWLNGPILLDILNDLLNRRNSLHDQFSSIIQVFFVVNLLVMIAVGIVYKIREKKLDRQRRASENQSWNQRMSEKYSNWQAAQ